MAEGEAIAVVPIRRAIISVSEKSGLVDFARELRDLDIEIFSTGGTRQALENAGIAARDIAAYTGFPEMMDGRLKTLHPKIFGGILARRDRSDDLQALASHDICCFDLIVVNLYPFEQTVARDGVTDAEAIEQIDIGGPSLIRASAKNHAFVTVVTESSQYADVLEELRNHRGTSLSLRRRFAQAAFHRTSAYDQAIARYFAESADGESADGLTIPWKRHGALRYGENPHQAASVYRDEPLRSDSLLAARQVNGKELSYNNYLDLDAALRIVRGFAQPTVAVIKHTNPCGLASHERLSVAAEQALAGDPVSAFGSILAFNRPIDVETADVLTRPDQFIEAILAPTFDDEALRILTTRPKWKANVRLLELPAMAPLPDLQVIRQIDGGCLIQQNDERDDDFASWQNVTGIATRDAVIESLKFAWRAVRYVRSNAIVIARDNRVCGVGAGQMSRVDSVELALRKSAGQTDGAVMASDAFFPFPDSIARAADAGIVAIVQPGGSRNDQAVIDACKEARLPMYFTGRRHFLH